MNADQSQTEIPDASLPREAELALVLRLLFSSRM
jgi:hypothetical protein